ncbi:MAG: YbaY family lipoprotein [Gomphosphaeria aponina SAG 52.96 = DSM 107014]|uniref:YbaY family lipoprotein n=1 Tax=Gomphosphaeria aponina SAG 52.96 = DSM 107014 TaxID=1521640 RepID=A0A941JS98_9CHRO|nr:YbaY family lipoprotein [Gomphosphaeria aponina SAG 52.96 = DSM 107014]
MKNKHLIFWISVMIISQLVGVKKVASVEAKIALDARETKTITNSNPTTKTSRNLAKMIKQIPNESNVETVTGTVAYRERIALPPNAVVKVKLLDISRADAPAIEISAQIITTAGKQVPIPFELIFNPSQIESNHAYAVRAEIFMADQLAFTTTKIYPVITQGNPQTVDLVLQKINKENLPNQLIGSEWLLTDLGGKGVIDNLQTTINFVDDNRIAGSGGCNNYFGSYKIDNNVLSVSGLGSTFKMCPAAVMNQESGYFQALQKAQNISIDGPYLFIEVDGLEQPLRFIRIME